MYVQTTGEGVNGQPLVGDVSICNPYSQSKYFAANSGNNFYCLVELERELMTPFVEKFKFWKYYSYKNNKMMHEQLLTQLYGSYRCNEAIKSYSMQSGVKYEYKIRLRPDSAFKTPVPLINTINFGPVADCNSSVSFGTIYYNEDWFNIGKSDDMDCLLDRYLDFTTNPLTAQILDTPIKGWHAEGFLVRLMKAKRNACLVDNPDLEVAMIRKSKGHWHNQYYPPAQPKWEKVVAHN